MWWLLMLASVCYAYDENMASHAVNLAQASYCVSSTNEWNCETCEPSVTLDYIVEENGSKALQGYDKETNSIFIAFRGSSNIQNWIDNIQIKQISPYNDTNIQVEKGFYKAYNEIKPELFDNLVDLSTKYNTKDISITGHSLGGSMATLMAYDILTAYPKYQVKYLITFGSPRTGNQLFVDSFNSYRVTSYRITHAYDMVPHVPEEFLHYHHISNEIWYNEANTQYKICNDYDNTEDDSCSNSCAPIHCTSVSDHSNYLNVTMGSDGMC